jgi:hypothetical protein
MNDTNQNLTKDLGNLKSAELKFARIQFFTSFIAVVSTIIGAVFAFTSLFDISIVSKVFDSLGGASNLIKLSIAIILGLSAGYLSKRTLDRKERRIDAKILRAVEIISQKEKAQLNH